MTLKTWMIFLRNNIFTIYIYNDCWKRKFSK